MKIYAFMLCLCLLSNSCYAMGETESMQCKNGIVSPGDSMPTVIQKCGQPADKRATPRRYKYAGRTYPATEQWLYNFGPNEFVYIAVFNGYQISLLYSTNDHGY